MRVPRSYSGSKIGKESACAVDGEENRHRDVVWKDDGTIQDNEEWQKFGTVLFYFGKNLLIMMFYSWASAKSVYMHYKCKYFSY